MTIFVTVEQKETVQSDDFYPFGLTFNSFRRIGGARNDYLYQGKELLENTDWYDFHARVIILLWVGLCRGIQCIMDLVDVGMGNNPIAKVDPDGKDPWKNNCTYTLELLKVIENPANFKIPEDLILTVEIIETKKDSYIQRSTSNNYDLILESEFFRYSDEIVD